MSEQRYYCTISRCSNLSYPPISVEGYKCTSCQCYNSIQDLKNVLLKYHYKGEDRSNYIDRIISGVDINDKLFYFSRLSRNHDCCYLYLYSTSNPNKIVYYKEDTYVLLTSEEDRQLWS